jgi:hypothetical protein
MVCGLGEEALKASVKIYQWTLFSCCRRKRHSIIFYKIGGVYAECLIEKCAFFLTACSGISPRMRGSSLIMLVRKIRCPPLRKRPPKNAPYWGLALSPD